jgi:two-component system response regulator PilR (NtrC family)
VPARHHILVVDDELSMRELLEIVLENAGYQVTAALGIQPAIEALEKQEFDCVVTDLFMGNDRNAGMKLLDWIRENSPYVPVVMMTAHGSVDSAVEAMQRGATDYIQKPFKNDEIRLRVENAIRQRNLRRENEALRTEQKRHARFEHMVGKSPRFLEVLDMIKRVAALPSTIAIHGESGSGKELVARALHQLSPRADKPFVPINCGGIPENLLESELFGYKKGAFTGAVEDKEGLFVVANEGTLFLDEIGEMPLSLQVKLLRVLDNSTITPVGGTQSIKVNVRIISATNRDLKQMADEGAFREDLYYRLNVIPIKVPPLRERADDIPLLARNAVRQHAEKMGRPPMDIAPDAEEALRAYKWPGNVRELGNVMERAVALNTTGRIEMADLPPHIQHYVPETRPTATSLPEEGLDLEAVVSDLEMALIHQALQRSKYSQKKAAQLLGLSPRSLRYRLQKYGIEAD